MAVLWARSARRPQAAKLPCVLRTRSKTCPLIRPSVRTGAPSPQGEGFGGESPPHPALRATFPPGGRLWWGIVPLIRPFGPPSPQGEGFGGESSPSSGPSGHLPPRGKALVGNRPLIRPFGPPSPEGEGLQAAKGRPYKSPRRRDTPKTKIRPSPQTGTTYWRR